MVRLSLAFREKLRLRVWGGSFCFRTFQNPSVNKPKTLNHSSRIPNMLWGLSLNQWDSWKVWAMGRRYGEFYPGVQGLGEESRASCIQKKLHGMIPQC